MVDKTCYYITQACIFTTENDVELHILFASDWWSLVYSHHKYIKINCFKQIHIFGLELWIFIIRACPLQDLEHSCHFQTQMAVKNWGALFIKVAGHKQIYSQAITQMRTNPCHYLELPVEKWLVEII